MRFRRRFVSTSRPVAIAAAIVLAVAMAATARAQESFLRGDANADGRIDISDPVFLLRHLFQGGPRLTCADSGDADDDGDLNISDSVRVLGLLFRGGLPLPAPGRECGPDLTGDELSCASYEPCADERARAPALTAFTLTPSGRGEFLLYDGPLGFRLGESHVRLWGHGLLGAREVVLSDASGLERSLGRDDFTAEAANETGLESIALDLHDDQRDVRLLFEDGRNEMGVEVVGAGGGERSNRLSIPVLTTADVDALGIVISGVNVPLHPTTGPVWIEYACRDSLTDAAWAMHVDFTVDVGTTWLPALSFVGEPGGDGPNEIACGPIVRQDGALFPGGGAVRTFVWDACRDDDFLALNADRVPREWDIAFRLRPELEAGIRRSTDHSVETPAVPYVYLPSCGGDDEEPAATSRFSESFDDDRWLDADVTTAVWEPGTLSAARGEAADPFGTGGEALVLEAQVDPAPGVAAFWNIDTDDMTLTHHALALVEGEWRHIATPRAFDNPGAAIGELHLASWTIEADARVVVTGSQPLVVRLAGPSGARTPDEELALYVAGELDVSGAAGQGGGQTPDAPHLPGAGGSGGPGGGGGGRGGRVELAGDDLRIAAFEAAAPGANGGGEGGESSAIWAVDRLRPSSVAGAPGGGGGHLLAGADGNYGSSRAAEYPPLRAGRGSSPRGERMQIAPTTGSGGGGGGASVSRGWQGSERPWAVGGSGGGGGGGGLVVYARGSIRVDGTILANGGDGGDGGTGVAPSGASAGAAGGGGSGGSIVLRALGAIEVASADSLQARGGGGGGGVSSQNEDAGDGEGAPGRIRLESTRAHTPAQAAPRAVTTRLTARLRDRLSRTSDRRLSVESVEGFPPRGVVRVDDEVMTYRVRSDARNRFEDLERTPHALAEHAVGALVVLVTNTWPPVDGVVEDGGMSELDSPFGLETGSGVDGALHLHFEQGIDPATGARTVDATGAPVSRWTFDTSAGVLRAPDGGIFLRGAGEPGVLELDSFIVDEGVVLRVVGPRPPQILVSGEALVDGTIDVSGEDGGALRFEPDQLPLPGIAGRAGAGGGEGGEGGNVEFRDGNPDNNDDPANTVFTDAQDGDLPERVRRLFPALGRGRGGAHGEVGLTCCAEAAGGGGGGANLEAGGDSVVDRLVHPDAIASGGESFGARSIRHGGVLFLAGGGGGGGGGASAESVPPGIGDFEGVVFPSVGRSPGTGGGGGGGALRLAAVAIRLGPRARLIARGGDAFQSVQYGGNGGAGAGGSVLIEAGAHLELDPSARIDVAPGTADRPPPSAADGRPLYAGNEARDGGGGAGSAGRIRLQVPSGARVARDTDRELMQWSVGPFWPTAVTSVARSLPFRFAGRDAHGATTRSQRLGAATVRHATPVLSGSRAVVLWEGALDSRDRFDAPARFGGPTADPRDLRDAVWGRFTVYFVVGPAAGEMPAIRALEVPIAVGE